MPFNKGYASFILSWESLYVVSSVKYSTIYASKENEVEAMF